MRRAPSPSRIAVASAYVFIGCFLCGPAFGLAAVNFAYWLFAEANLPFEALMPAYAFALIFGGVQGYRAGLKLTDFLDRNGYISFSFIVKTTVQVALTPSALIAIAYFIGAWAAHDLRGLFLWPLQAFVGALAVHAFAAVGISALIFPLMRRPKQRFPGQ